MNYELIMEEGDYALILRGNKMKEYAVVNRLDKKSGSWGHTVAYYAYEYDGMKLDLQARAFANAIDCFRMKTEGDYITRSRLEELATLFKDGLIEDDEYEAMIYFDETCEMLEHEKRFFGIGESEEE